jgi:uncharacterized protein YciI/uncharacterized protein YndB with AHSA1/START domain
MTTFAPVRRQVVVSATPERAFAAWTDDLHTWWPFERHSVYGQGSSAAFVDGQLIETSPDGQSCSWGSVTTWRDGERLTMTWHPGSDEDSATTVDVRFDPLDDGRTLVTLTHTGWEKRADSADARLEYRSGWPTVMGGFAQSLSGESHSDGHTWLVLQHTVAPEFEGQVFESPLFADHIAFLQQVHSQGWLVAAGNLPDSPGSGMTILRVPDAAVREAVLAAQDDDQSVVKGLFEVQIRLWNVALTA